MFILTVLAGADLQKGLNEIEFYQLLDDRVDLPVLLLVDTFHLIEDRQQVNETNTRNEAEVGLLVRILYKWWIIIHIMRWVLFNCMNFSLKFLQGYVRDHHIIFIIIIFYSKDMEQTLRSHRSLMCPYNRFSHWQNWFQLVYCNTFY